MDRFAVHLILFMFCQKKWHNKAQDSLRLPQRRELSPQATEGVTSRFLLYTEVEIDTNSLRFNSLRHGLRRATSLQEGGFWVVPQDIPLWADRRTSMSGVSAVRGSAPDISFVQAFLSAKKNSRQKCPVKQIFTLNGQTGGPVCPACLRCAGAHRTFLLPSFSFCKEKRSGYRLRRLRPRERRRARTFLPLAVDILLRKPCTLLR